MFYKVAITGIDVIAYDLDKCFTLKLSFDMHKWISVQ